MAKVLRYLAALLASVGLGSLVNFLRRRSERKQAEQERQRHEDRAAEIARKREQGHEPTEVRIGPLAAILAGSLVFAAIAGVGLWVLLYLLSSNAQQADVPLSPLATAGPPPEPRLQANPPADWQQMRATDEAILGSAGQAPDGSYHIPIDRAMDLLAQRGLPAAPGGSQGLSYDAAHNLESNGGQPPGDIPEPQAVPAAPGAPSGTPTAQPGATPTPTRSSP